MPKPWLVKLELPAGTTSSQPWRSASQTNATSPPGLLRPYAAGTGGAGTRPRGPAIRRSRPGGSGCREPCGHQQGRDTQPACGRVARRARAQPCRLGPPIKSGSDIRGPLARSGPTGPPDRVALRLDRRAPSARVNTASTMSAVIAGLRHQCSVRRARMRRSGIQGPIEGASWNSRKLSSWKWKPSSSRLSTSRLTIPIRRGRR